jgi:hypothetical protein
MLTMQIMDVRDEVERLLQQLFIAAAENPSLELETTEIVPLARLHALEYQRCAPENVSLSAQVAVLRAMREIASQKQRKPH